MKYTARQIEDMNYAQLCEIKSIEELPDAMADKLRKEIMKDANIVINTGVEVRLVKENGRREFYAKRHSDRFTGSSFWTVSYYKRGYGIEKQCIGYGFGVVKKRFGKTADDTPIPAKVGYKKDVMAIIDHIDWAKELINK